MRTRSSSLGSVVAERRLDTPSLTRRSPRQNAHDERAEPCLPRTLGEGVEARARPRPANLSRLRAARRRHRRPSRPGQRARAGHPPARLAPPPHTGACDSPRAGQLEQQARAPERELDAEFDRPARPERPTSRRRVWEGAIAIPLDGPVDVIRPGGLSSASSPDPLQAVGAHRPCTRNAT
jgi:hypothetical protein